MDKHKVYKMVDGENILHIGNVMVVVTTRVINSRRVAFESCGSFAKCYDIHPIIPP